MVSSSNTNPENPLNPIEGFFAGDQSISTKKTSGLLGATVVSSSGSAILQTRVGQIVIIAAKILRDNGNAKDSAKKAKKLQEKGFVPVLISEGTGTHEIYLSINELAKKTGIAKKEISNLSTDRLTIFLQQNLDLRVIIQSSSTIVSPRAHIRSEQVQLIKTLWEKNGEQLIAHAM